MADGKVTITLKAGDKFDAPWIVVSGDTPAEALDNLRLLGELGASAEVANAARGLQSVYAIGQAMGPVQTVPQENPAAAGGQVVQFPTPTAPPQAPPQAAPAAPAQQAPPANAMFCPHGQRTFRSGQKNGRKWTAYFCPLPQGHPDQCQAIWG